MKSPNHDTLRDLELSETTAQTAAVIHLRIPRAEIQHAMPPAIEEVLATISAQGQSPQGPMFAHHLALSDETFDFEVGFPVARPISPKGRVKPGELPAATVARAVFHGDYEGLYGAWEEFGKRLNREFGKVLEKQRLTPAATLWETYRVGPETSADPNTWQTELNQPLVRY